MKHSVKRLTSVLAAASAITLALAACSSGDTGSGDTGGDAADDSLHEVKVGIVQLPIFAPVYVAQANGYFEDEGLDVSLQNVKSGSDAIPLASSGKLDVVAAGVSAGFFSAVESGLDVKFVGSMGVAGPEDEEPASALVVSQEAYDDGVTSIEDLKGKRIAASGGTGATGAYYISLALEQAGISADDVEFVNVSNPDMPTALKTGSVDAAFPSAPFWSNAVDDGVAKKIWQLPQGTSGTGVMYGGDFIDSEYAQPFFDALARGAQDLQGDDKYSDENLKIIGDATDQTPDEVASVPLYDWFPDLHPLPEQMAGMEKLWLQFGALEYDAPLDPSSYVDESFAENVES